MPTRKREAEDTSQTSRPVKKIKKSINEERKKVEAKPKSSLVSEEIDFPRGGGTSLTPLEYKNLRAEAVKEVQDELMFEDSQTKRPKPSVKRPPKGRPSGKQKEDSNDVEEKSDTIRIEHLNYKRIAVGTRLLCQITAIHPLALIVSLPNQLLGHIPITHVSTVLTKRLETVTEDSDKEQSNSDDEEQKESARVPSLYEMFSVGQYVRAIATTVSPGGVSGPLGLGKHRDEVTKASRRVELSISPDQVNSGVSKKDLRKGFTTLQNISASIKSQEDHGYLLDFGILDISGFLSLDAAGRGNFGERKLPVGQVIETSISKMSDNGRTCIVSVDPSVIRAASLSEVHNISSVLPGLLVHALITAVVPWGLNVQLLGFFQGTLDLFHLPSCDAESRFSAGQKIKARILWDMVGLTPRRFALSILPHVVSLDVSRVDSEQTVEESFPNGSILDSVKVERVESEWGLVCVCPNGIRGFVHISHVSDEHVPSLSSNTGPWKIGSTHRARVIGFSALDGLLQLSLQASILEQKFLQVADVQVAEIIKGTIKHLSDVGLFISLSDHVDGVVWPAHYSDIKLKHPERKFKPGTTVKCRVLVVDTERSRISLTLKKTLLDSELPVISRFEDAKVGTVANAVVVKYLPKSLLVEYFGGVRALVPLTEASDGSVQNLEELFFLGQVVKTRILGNEPDTQRILASIRKASSNFNSPPGVESVEIGSLVSGKVTDIHKDNLVIDLYPTSVRALLSLSNLANSRQETVAQLRTSVRVSDVLEDLIVVSKNTEKRIVIVATKFGPDKQDRSNSALTLESIQEGQLLSGRVVGHGRLGSSVRISNHIQGYIHPTDSSDNYASGTAFPPVPSFINCVAVRIDKGNKRALLSTRASHLRPDDHPPIVDRVISSLDDIKVGDSVRGFVKSVAEHGLFVGIGRSIDARVQIKELFDEYIKDWKSKFQVNQLVQGRISNIDLGKNQVEMTFRSGEIRPSQSSIGIGSLHVGEKLDGTIKKIEDYGMFIEVKGSKISGLCHKSELSDDKNADVVQALKMFREGDHVKAIVLSISLEKRRVNFGLKPSYFSSEDFELPDTFSDMESTHPVLSEQEMSPKGGSEEEEASGDDEGEDGSADDDVVVSEEAKEDRILSEESNEVIPTLQLTQGFSWSNQPGNNWCNDSGEEGDSSDPDLEETPKSKKKKRRHQIEYDLTADMHKRAPESTADFERMLVGSPNSSFLWVQYMSFQLQLSEIEKAREVGRRALQTINFREEQEKMNVWIALLNLENAYGTEQTSDAVFKEAANHNDSKAIHLKFATVLDQSNKLQQAEELYSRTVKKFGGSSKVWTSFGEYYLGRGNAEEARKLLPRSLQSLEKRKHLKTISKFAQLEYKLGEAERGRTIFEGIVDSHPKRLDLWSIYVDMEVGQGDVNSVRNIFDRVLAQKLSSKKAKFFFKKWLELERTIGDEEGAETVKRKAIAWTQSNGSRVD